MLFYEQLPNSFFVNESCLRFTEEIKDVLNEKCDFLSEKSIFFFNGEYRLWLDWMTFEQSELVCNLISKL